MPTMPVRPTWSLAALLAAALAAGCTFGSKSPEPPPPFSDEKWKALTEGRLDPGVRELQLTVIDLDEKEAGRQLIAFELDLSKDCENPFLPMSCERSVVVLGPEQRRAETETVRAAILQAWIDCRATAANPPFKSKHLIHQWVSSWPQSDPENASAQPLPPSSAEFRKVRMVKGVLHGELLLDKAKIRADINKGFAGDAGKVPGLKWQSHAVLSIAINNRWFKGSLPKDPNYVFVNAGGLVRDWMIWTWPE